VSAAVATASSVTASAQATKAPSPSEAASAAPAAAAPPAAPSAEPDAVAASAPVDWKNEAKYVTESDELTQRARGLFEAIVKQEPPLAEDFWFPKEPFIPLKDVKNPGRYWDNLHSAYLDDVRALHRKRKSWDGAVFERFTLGSTPKWVKPGDEVNKIGYYRSFRGTIHYRIDDKPAKLEVHTLITWQGRWYVTHLRKIKKKS
jgi:hypothetical protein